MFSGGRLTYSGSFGIAGVDSAHLGISYTMQDSSIGVASSTIRIPGYFEFTDTAQSIVWGDDYEFEWEGSEGATGYWANFASRLSYVDTAGVIIYNQLDYDTILAIGDTSLLAQTSSLFPDSSEFESLSSFYATFTVRGISGPWFEGEANNITGDAFGLFVGASGQRIRRISLAGPAPSPPVSAMPSRESDQMFEQKLLELYQGSLK
jgi:hypothetical protein